MTVGPPPPAAAASPTRAPVAPRGWRLLGASVLVAVAYLVGGRLGLLLAIPPGYSSALWPPAGVALLAVLLGGKRLWPAIVAGSFLVNLTTAIGDWTAAEALRSAGVAFGIGLGAALQAVAAAWLVRRRVGFPAALSGGREVIGFLVLAGPVACVISATMGNTVLWAAGLVAGADWLFSWWTWWIGDAIGVVIVAPLALCWIGRPAGLWRARRRSVALPLVVVLSGVIVLFVYSRTQEQRRLELEFRSQADSQGSVFERGLERYLEVVRSLEALFATTPDVSRPAFSEYAGRVLARNPGLQAISWNPRIGAAERGRFELAARRDGLLDFRLTERTTAGRLVEAATRPEYVAVYYIEPLAGNEAALGYDVASDPARRTALERARDSGEAAATAPIRLVQETESQAGMLVFVPVYSAERPPAGLAERRRLLRGFATAVLRLGDVLELALTGFAAGDLAVGLYDVRGDGERELLAAAGAAGAPAGRGLAWSRVYDVAGRRLELIQEAGTAFLLARQGWGSWGVLAAGLVLAGLLGALLLVLTGRASELERFNRFLGAEVEERRQVEAERTRLIADLEARNADLERYSYAVSHDLKSPLITIGGFVDLLERELRSGRTGEAAEFVGQIRAAVERMRRLLEGLLQLVRSGRSTEHGEVVRFSELAEEAVALIAGRLMGGGGIGVEVEPTDVALRGNAAQLLEVLQNLVDNAAKFMGERPDPRIWLGARREGDEVVCWVGDNGRGIAPGHQERIFDLFHRLDPSREGTGIGLALARQIVERNGGRIWVESEGEGRGSVFYFTAPAAPPPGEGGEAAPDRRPPPGRSRTARAQG